MNAIDMLEDPSCCKSSPSCSVSPKANRHQKARSLDFGRICARSSVIRPGDDAHMDSLYSRRPSHGSFSLALLDVDTPDDLYLHADPLGAASSWSTQDQEAIPAAGFFGSLTLRKLSVFILCVAMLIEFANQVHKLDDEYDAFLSWEVIRPPLSSHNHASASNRPQLGLGSAAISSITEALSPILPFTGGVDLRREEYWTNSDNWFETLRSVAGQIQDAFQRSWQDGEEGLVEVGNITIGNSRETPTSQASGNKRIKARRVSAVSAQKPFVSLEDIAELTLVDVAKAFRYAVESSKPEFNENRFMNSLPPRMKKVMSSIQQAVAKSRGQDAKDASVVDPSGVFGDVDALKFAAAMRIFGEWRVLRLVPDGYKGYAVGMNLGHKDIVQNVAKIEHGVHAYLDYCSGTVCLNQDGEEGTGTELRSPTLRELLQFEIDVGTNPANRLPRLGEKSAAMGLLWVRRQLHYQTLLFDNVGKPERFPTTPDAVMAAYATVYDRFHGWAVQKIFNYSFQAAPEASEIYRHMNPQRLKAATAAAQRKKPSSPGPAQESKGSRKTREENPVEAFLNHVGGEWDKFVGGVGQLFGKPPSGRSLEVRGGGGSQGLRGQEFDEFVTKEMTRDAHEKIAAYLEVAFPLLDNLAGLFATLNMDDPTRV